MTLPLFALLLTIIFPVIKLGGIPLFPLFGITFLAWFQKTLQINKKYLLLIAVPLLYFPVHSFISIISGDKLGTKDISFFALFLFYFFFISTFFSAKDLTKKALKIFFYLNFILIVLAFFKITLPTVIFYKIYGIGNIVSESKYLEMVSSRPGGLLVHPAWLGLGVYLIAKYFEATEKKYSYTLMALFMIVSSKARTALAIFLVVETYLFIINRKTLLGKIAGFTLAGLFVVTLSLILYFYVPFIHFFADLMIQDISSGKFRSFSVSHRLEMLKILFSQNWFHIFFGGNFSSAKIASSIVFVDSEFVMRSLQFGFLGYFCLFTPLFILIYSMKKIKEKTVKHLPLVLFVLTFFGSFTTNIMSNPVFIILLSAIIGNLEYMKMETYGEIK